LLKVIFNERALKLEKKGCSGKLALARRSAKADPDSSRKIIGLALH